MGFLVLFTFATLGVIYLLALGQDTAAYCARCNTYYDKFDGHFCPSPSRQETAR